MKFRIIGFDFSQVNVIVMKNAVVGLDIVRTMPDYSDKIEQLAVGDCYSFGGFDIIIYIVRVPDDYQETR